MRRDVLDDDAAEVAAIERATKIGADVGRFIGTTLSVLAVAMAVYALALFAWSYVRSIR